MARGQSTSCVDLGDRTNRSGKSTQTQISQRSWTYDWTGMAMTHSPAQHVDAPLGRPPMGYADELRRVIRNWRRREWGLLRRKARETTRKPLATDDVSEAMVRCAWLLCHAYAGAHHVGRVKFRSNNLLQGDEQWLEVSHHGDMSTTDSPVLTRLVVAAHEVAVRLEVSSGGARGLLLKLYPRARTASTMTSHPTIDVVVDEIRSRWAPCPVAIPSGEAT